MSKKQSHSDHYDVIIVGGGLAGAALACLLNPEYRTLILDKTLPEAISPAHQSITAKALALSPASQIILQRAGVGEQLAPYYTWIDQIFVSKQASCSTVRMRAKDVGMPALGYVIDSHRLMAVLQQQAVHRSQITWLQIDQVEVMHPLPQGVEIQVNAKEKKYNLSCSLLIAADGTNSKVAELAGMNFISQSVQQHALLIPVELENAHAGIALERFTDEGTWAFLPLFEKSGMVVWTDHTRAVKQLFSVNEEKYLELIAQHLSAISTKISALGKVVHYPLKVGKLSQLYRGNVVAIGNAAQTLHPIAAQGFNLALRDIYELANYLGSSDGKMTMPALWLPDYAAKRKWDHQRISWLTESLQSAESTHLGRKMIRKLGMSLCAFLPPLKHALMRTGMGLPL